MQCTCSNQNYLYLAHKKLSNYSQPIYVIDSNAYLKTKLKLCPLMKCYEKLSIAASVLRSLENSIVRLISRYLRLSLADVTLCNVIVVLYRLQMGRQVS